MRIEWLVLHSTAVFFIGSFVLKPRTNLGMNFVRGLNAKIRVLAAMIE